MVPSEIVFTLIELTHLNMFYTDISNTDWWRRQSRFVKEIKSAASRLEFYTSCIYLSSLCSNSRACTRCIFRNIAVAPTTNADNPAMKLHRIRVLLDLLLSTDTTSESCSPRFSVGRSSNMGRDMDKLSSACSSDRDIELNSNSDSSRYGMDMDSSNVADWRGIDNDSSSSDASCLAFLLTVILLSLCICRRSTLAGDAATLPLVVWLLLNLWVRRYRLGRVESCAWELYGKLPRIATRQRRTKYETMVISM